MEQAWFCLRLDILFDLFHDRPSKIQTLFKVLAGTDTKV
jgi:hypothetical protein